MTLTSSGMSLRTAATAVIGTAGGGPSGCGCSASPGEQAAAARAPINSPLDSPSLNCIISAFETDRRH